MAHPSSKIAANLFSWYFLCLYIITPSPPRVSSRPISFTPVFKGHADVVIYIGQVACWDRGGKAEVVLFVGREDQHSHFV